MRLKNALWQSLIVHFCDFLVWSPLRGRHGLPNLNGGAGVKYRSGRNGPAGRPISNRWEKTNQDLIASTVFTPWVNRYNKLIFIGIIIEECEKWIMINHQRDELGWLV